MGFNDDYYWTGGGLSDWSGGSAGKFSSGSSSGGSSGGGGSNNSDPNDWKYGCGCFVAIVVGVLLYFWADVWDWINYKLFCRGDDIEVIEEQCDTTIEMSDDVEMHVFEPGNSVETVVPRTSATSAKSITSKHSSSYHSSSRSYYYDDEEDDDEDEDIKDKRQYDDYDDDEADDWE